MAADPTASPRKIEGRTEFENNVLGEGITDFCKRSDNQCINFSYDLILISTLFLAVLMQHFRQDSDEW